MKFFSKLLSNKRDILKEIIIERNLRPLGNKKRLVLGGGENPLDYRAQFRDKDSAEQRYYEAFIRFAEDNSPPALLEVMVAYTPNTVYPEKYSFILPYFNAGHEDYQRWAREAMYHCNDIQRQHSYSAGNDYSYVPVSISAKGAVIQWTILPPRGFDVNSPQAQELLADPYGMGFKAVKIEGEADPVPVQPAPKGPWVGVLFDISKFEGAMYGRAATRELLDMVSVQQLSGCVIHGGDLLPEGRYWCLAVHTASQEQVEYIESVVNNSKNARLAQDTATLIRGQQVPVNTLPFQGYVSWEGMYVGI